MAENDKLGRSKGPDLPGGMPPAEEKRGHEATNAPTSNQEAVKAKAAEQRQGLQSVANEPLKAQPQATPTQANAPATPVTKFEIDTSGKMKEQLDKSPVGVVKDFLEKIKLNGLEFKSKPFLLTESSKQTSFIAEEIKKFWKKNNINFSDLPGDLKLKNVDEKDAEAAKEAFADGYAGEIKGEFDRQFQARQEFHDKASKQIQVVYGVTGRDSNNFDLNVAFFPSSFETEYQLYLKAKEAAKTEEDRKAEEAKKKAEADQPIKERIEKLKDLGLVSMFLGLFCKTEADWGKVARDRSFLGALVFGFFPRDARDTKRYNGIKALSPKLGGFLASLEAKVKTPAVQQALDKMSNISNMQKFDIFNAKEFSKLISEKKTNLPQEKPLQLEEDFVITGDKANVKFLKLWNGSITLAKGSDVKIGGENFKADKEAKKVPISEGGVEIVGKLAKDTIFDKVAYVAGAPESPK